MLGPSVESLSRPPVPATEPQATHPLKIPVGRPGAWPLSPVPFPVGVWSLESGSPTTTPSASSPSLSLASCCMGFPPLPDHTSLLPTTKSDIIFSSLLPQTPAKRFHARLCHGPQHFGATLCATIARRPEPTEPGQARPVDETATGPIFHPVTVHHLSGLFFALFCLIPILLHILLFHLPPGTPALVHSQAYDRIYHDIRLGLSSPCRTSSSHDPFPLCTLNTCRSSSWRAVSLSSVTPRHLITATAAIRIHSIFGCFCLRQAALPTTQRPTPVSPIHIHHERSITAGSVQGPWCRERCRRWNHQDCIPETGPQVPPR